MSFASDQARAQRAAARAQKRSYDKRLRQIKGHFRRDEESIKARTNARIDTKMKLAREARHKVLVTGAGEKFSHHAKAPRARIEHPRANESRDYQQGGGDAGAQRSPRGIRRGEGQWAFVRSPR